MEILAIVLNVAVPLFAVSSMLSVGLRYPLRQIIEPLRDIPGVITALLANFVLLPLLAFGIIKLLSLDRDYALGAIIVACAAGAPMLVKLAANAKEQVSFAAAILVLLLIVTIFYMPLVVPLLAEEGTTVSAWAIARPLIMTMLLPLIVGFVGRAFLPAWADRLAPFLGIIINISLWTMVVLILILNFGEVIGVFGSGAILASILLLGGAWIIGYLVGTFDKEEKVVLGFATAQRNFAAANVVAIEAFTDSGVLVMAVVISMVALLLIPFSSWFGKRKEKGKQPLPTET